MTAWPMQRTALSTAKPMQRGQWVIDMQSPVTLLPP